MATIMKCAKCKLEDSAPNSDKFGELFVSTKSTSENKSDRIMLDTNTNYAGIIAGIIVSWFICNKCVRKKAAINPLRPGIIFMTKLLFPFGFIYLIFHIIFGDQAITFCISFGIIILFFFTRRGKLFLKSHKKSLESNREKIRDRILQQSIGKLIQREDFINIHGSVKIDKSAPYKTLTRYQRAIMSQKRNSSS